MTNPRHNRRTSPAPMVGAFPTPGEEVRLAYRELHIAVSGSEEQKKALGNHALLPRPWDPASCLEPDLRHGLWEWLEDVVIWLNHDYSWDAAWLIPSCWPLHPHLVHEIAVLADQRRRAGLAMTSDALEEWHRYCVPAFTDRMRHRLRAHCDDGHTGWPAKPRHSEHLAEAATERRENAFAHDVDALPASRRRADDQSTQSTQVDPTRRAATARTGRPRYRRDPRRRADRCAEAHPRREVAPVMTQGTTQETTRRSIAAITSICERL